MDVTRAIQAAVARADMLACRVSVLPWEKIGLSLLMAWLVIHVVKAVRNDG